MSWSTPEDFAAQVARLWERGRLLQEPAQGGTSFPLPLRMKCPTVAEVSDRFEDVRRWIRAVEDGSKTRRGFGYELQWQERDYRSVGRNRLPVGAVIPTRDDALRLAHKRRDAERFAEVVAMTAATCPTLTSWLATKPLVALAAAEEWEKILAVVAAFCLNPRPDVYLRQLDIDGIDTKFIEARRPLLNELLSVAMPAGTIDSDADSFEQRYGLRKKPPMIRFRTLDPRHRVGGFSDLTVPVAELSERHPNAARVFITENEVDALAFPDVADALIIFGLGYALERLDPLVEWLRHTALVYWGDIDTHGFAMLDRLRSRLPQARSLLMDEATLLEHRRLWVREDTPHRGNLSRLYPDEQTVFDALMNNRFGDRVRLEQERIAFGWVTRAIAAVSR